MLQTQASSYAPWGIAIVKATVLAKFMLVGRAMKIGERYTTSPLIWPTLHKAFAFLVLLVVLTIMRKSSSACSTIGRSPPRWTNLPALSFTRPSLASSFYLWC